MFHRIRFSETGQTKVLDAKNWHKAMIRLGVLLYLVAQLHLGCLWNTSAIVLQYLRKLAGIISMPNLSDHFPTVFCALAVRLGPSRICERKSAQEWTETK